MAAQQQQLHQQRSNWQQFQLRQPCSLAAMQPCSLAAVQPCSRAAVQPCSRAALQPCSHAALQPCSHAAMQPSSHAALQPCSRAALQPCSRAALQPCSLVQSCAALQPGSHAALCSLAAEAVIRPICRGPDGTVLAWTELDRCLWDSKTRSAWSRQRSAVLRSHCRNVACAKSRHSLLPWLML